MRPSLLSPGVGRSVIMPLTQLPQIAPFHAPALVRLITAELSEDDLSYGVEVDAVYAALVASRSVPRRAGNAGLRRLPDLAPPAGACCEAALWRLVGRHASAQC